MTISAADKARIRWSWDRRQRGRQRRRDECLRMRDLWNEPAYRATWVRSIGEDEVNSIIRANETYLAEASQMTSGRMPF
jgi:hypothetical protein